MPVFVYQALQAGGGKTTGEIEALSQGRGSRRIGRRGEIYR